MRSVLTDDPIDIIPIMDGEDRRPELRKHKTLKAFDVAAENRAPNHHQTNLLSGARIPSIPSPEARRLQRQRDYEMAASILEARNRADFARRRPHVSFEQQRISMEATFRSAPGGRARVVLDEESEESPDAVVRRSLRAASEAYLRHSEAAPAAGLSSSENDCSSSSRDDDSGSTGGKKKKKTVSFQDESGGVEGVAALSSSSRRHLMDQARCNDDESGPGNGHTSSPIHAACFKGDHVVVAHLLGHYGVQDAAKLVNSICSCGMTPLQVACDQGHAKVVKLLLRRQARANKRSSQALPPAHASSRTSHLHTGISLVGVAKKRHRSCLALASARRNAEIVELLLDHGAHVDEDALVTASALGDTAIARILMQTQKKSAVGGLASGLEKLWGGSSSASTSSGSGNATGELEASWISSAAAVAVANDHPGVLPVLLGDGHSAASKARIVQCAIEATTLADYKLLRCLTKLFDHALLIDARDANHNTLLHVAVKQASSRCVTLLIRLGVDVNARDALSITPLYMACARGQSSIVKLLLNAGASCEAMGPNDETPLHIAAQENYLSCVTLLLCEGNAPVDGTTLDKCTALHLACQRGNTAVAKCLLDHGADVNARTVCDETPLLKASRMSNMETVKLLLSRDAEVATSSTSSISSCGSSVRTASRTTGDYAHTASTSSSVFSTGSSVRSLGAESDVDRTNTNSSSLSRSTNASSTGSSSSSSRRRHQHSQALLQRLAAHQLPRRAEEEAEEAAEAAAAASSSSASSGRSDQIFMAKSNSHKSFKGWLKSVVKNK